MNEYQKQFNLFCKILCYGWAGWWFLGFLRFLPDSLSDKIVNLLLAKIGL